MTCIGKDPRCPCQDGDACHYKDCGGTKAWPVPKAEPPPEWPLIKNILDEYGLQAIDFVAEWKAAQQQAEPVQERSDGMPTSKAERDLRRMLCIQRHGGSAYMDDGEASFCGDAYCRSIDYMRESIESIKQAWYDAGIKKLSGAQPEQQSEPVPHWDVDEDNPDSLAKHPAFRATQEQKAEPVAWPMEEQPDGAVIPVDPADMAPPQQQAEPDRRPLQAEGKHPAPCARHCEAKAFEIEIRSLKSALETQAASKEDMKVYRSIVDNYWKGLAAKAEQQAEPTCPDCKEAVLYECVACSSSNYPPKLKENT